MYISFQDSLSEIKEIGLSDLPLRTRYIHLRKILERNCREITHNESLQFPSFFARIVFIAQKYDLPETLEWKLQSIRAKSHFLQKDERNTITQKQYGRSAEAIILFFSIISGEATYVPVSETEEDETVFSKTNNSKIRIQVTEIDIEKKLIFGKSPTLPNETVEIYFAHHYTENALFYEVISRLWVGAQLNIIDPVIDGNKIRSFKNIILEPDYLIDASSISECFCDYGNSELHYFRRKFEAPANSHYILLGNLANFFLDELVNSPHIEDTDFETVFLRSFKNMPFAYMSCREIQDNASFRNFMTRAKSQFENIKRVLSEDLSSNNFDLSQCVLEPSFYSEKYGFQGRLDLLQPASENDHTHRIIELKSGKPPYPYDDPAKIAPNHEAQVTVYRLMIQSVSKQTSRSVYPTILYSSADKKGENLRLAAVYKTLENEILNIRNLIVANEHDLYTGNDETVNAIFNKLFDRENYKRTPSFFENKLNDLQNTIGELDETEKQYFHRFISFISRELYLLKTGDETYDSSMSISSLWNTSFSDRKDALEVFDNLAIESIDMDGRDMKIRFHREESSDCVNFREGELCILYPKGDEDNAILSSQILKGNVAEINTDNILLRFRYKQKNRHLFDENKLWVVEHDKLDHTYNQMYRSLFAFISAPKEKRQLLLGINPDTTAEQTEDRNQTPNDLQEKIIRKALAAPNYFLIVGPPGTGKTSVFARRLIEEYYKQENINILLIAYTNRAVDELCETIANSFGESGDACNKYIRIGTELSCGDRYRHNLLQNLSANVQTRKELAEIIQSRRIVVGTLAAINGRPELFDVKSFHVAIIDEASQILEPQIVGLLPLFDKFIMIGDHKQLSTITLQSEEKSSIDSPLLNSIELYNCRESLFERLFRICDKKGHTDLYDTLIYHGRMHRDIARLVNHPFYNDVLKPITKRQILPLPYSKFDKDNNYQNIIASSRAAFISVKTSVYTNLSGKTNEHEADIVANMVQEIYDLYLRNGMEFIADKIVGIISPYRNQIALIKDKLQKVSKVDFNGITVDTPERFQGSQRDIIIISACMNHPYQLQYFSNLDREKIVDRKLNVMLTRAREQLFFIGNEIILSENDIYRSIINEMDKYSICGG